MKIMKAANWDFDMFEARYYGWKWCLCIGPYIILVGKVKFDWDDT